MLTHYPYATVLDSPDLRALVLKAVAWGPPGETLSTVAAKLLHGELVGFSYLEEPDGVNDAILAEPVLVGREGVKDQLALSLKKLFVVHGISLLEFDPLGVVVNVAYLAAGPQVLGPFLDELAALAQRYGFQALVCYSRRPGMGKLLGRHGWVEDGAAVAPAPGFKRYATATARIRCR